MWIWNWMLSIKGQIWHWEAGVKIMLWVTFKKSDSINIFTAQLTSVVVQHTWPGSLMKLCVITMWNSRDFLWLKHCLSKSKRCVCALSSQILRFISLLTAPLTSVVLQHTWPSSLMKLSVIILLKRPGFSDFCMMVQLNGMLDFCYLSKILFAYKLVIPGLKSLSCLQISSLWSWTLDTWKNNDDLWMERLSI